MIKQAIHYIYIIAGLLLTSCLADEELSYETYVLPVTLQNPVTGMGQPSIQVTLTSTLGTTWQAETDAQGVARFTLPAGLYDLSASGSYDDASGTAYLLNCSVTGIVVNAAEALSLSQVKTYAMTASRRGSLIIREMYFGGCQKDDGSGAYYRDKYVALYNNGQLPITLHRLCLGMASPYNAHATNGNYQADGSLSYASLGFIPAIQAIWHMNDSLRLEGGEEVVIALNGAVDHTVSYSKSVDLSKGEYYCTYDPLVFTNTSYYPVPSEMIPTAHYLSAELYGMGNAWPFSQLDPAFFIFDIPADIDITAYANHPDHLWYNNGIANASNACIQIPTEWILDGVEVFTSTSTANRKRLTDAIDAGAVYFTGQYGFSVHRCVDVEATRAIPGNAAHLVYDLPSASDKGTNVVPADPSGINAAASQRQGAIIIYQDTNNSSHDLYERYQASLRD